MTENHQNAFENSPTNPTNTPAPRRVADWILLAKIAVTVLVFGMIFGELYRSWGAITQYEWRPNFAWLTFAAVMYLLAWIPAAIFWHHLLWLFGQQPTLYRSLRAYMIGHLGKYTPGKAMVVLIRAALVRSDAVRASVAAAAVFYETFTMMTAGSLLALFIIGLQMTEHPQWWFLMACALGAFLINGAVSLPQLFRTVVLKMGIGRGDEAVERGLHKLNFSTIIIGWLTMSVSWIILGVSLWGTMKGIGIEVDLHIVTLLRFTAAMSLSVVLGFLAMLPGGLGVREWVLAQLLTLYFMGMSEVQRSGLNPEAIGIIVAATHRVISIIAELFIAAVMWKNMSKETNNDKLQIKNEESAK